MILVFWLLFFFIVSILDLVFLFSSLGCVFLLCPTTVGARKYELETPVCEMAHQRLLTAGERFDRSETESETMCTHLFASKKSTTMYIYYSCRGSA